MIHNAGEFAVEKYERIAKDKRVHGIVHLLDNEVMRIVAAAQPKIMARASITGPSSHIDDSPAPSHPADRDAGVSLQHSPRRISQGDGDLSAELMNLSREIPMPMGMPDIAWSPALADEIGWDWGDFSQLFAEPPI